MNRMRHATVRIGVAAAAMTALAACDDGRGPVETGAAQPDGREIPVKTAP